MKLPNWFCITWWVMLLTGLTYFLHGRYPYLASGRGVPADIIIFLVWVALWLLPLASELSLFGLKLKKEVEAIHKDVNQKMDTIRADIRNQIDFRAQINPQFTIPIPPSDAQLPHIEEQVRRAVEVAMRSYGVPHDKTEQAAQLSVSEDESYLFGVRLNIERELRRIYRNHFPDETTGRYTSVIAISRVLANSEVIDPDLANAVREVYRACSAAVHSEDISEAQVRFVREVALELLGTLRAIP